MEETLCFPIIFQAILRTFCNFAFIGEVNAKADINKEGVCKTGSVLLLAAVGFLGTSGGLAITKGWQKF